MRRLPLFLPVLLLAACATVPAGGPAGPDLDWEKAHRIELEAAAADYADTLAKCRSANAAGLLSREAYDRLLGAAKAAEVSLRLAKAALAGYLASDGGPAVTAETVRYQDGAKEAVRDFRALAFEERVPGVVPPGRMP